MKAEPDSVALRRYVLGGSSAEERDSIERAYFDDPEVLELVCAAEEDLIDGYLSKSLAGEERERFEAYYLAAPQHRTRVGVARALRTAAASSDHRIEPTRWTTSTALWDVRGWPRLARVAAAAVLVVMVGGVTWLLRPASEPNTAIVMSPPSAPAVTSPSAPTAREPREPEVPPREKPPAPPVAPIVALSISPINVRGAGDPASLSIPFGTRTIRLLLQGEAAEPPLTRGRAIVRTVPGREVWRGPTLPRSTSPSAFASIDIAAERLPPDDYIVALLAPDASGRRPSDVERYRYFFRVRQGKDDNRR